MRDDEAKGLSEGAREFAQAILGRPVPSSNPEVISQEKLAQLEWLATFLPLHEEQLRRLRREEAKARQMQEHFAWLASISAVSEAVWDPAKHPRGGFSQNRGWFSPTSGAGGSSAAAGPSYSFGGKQRPSIADSVLARNRAVADATGTVTPDMVRTNRMALDVKSKLALPGEVARAAAAGAHTGAKAVVNGSATAVKNVATLGLSTSQLELIGVTDKDRENGYDTAVSIATASGEVLIAVGTAGLASALAKGGAIAQNAGGVLVAYDAAGNAVGVVQGTYDAATNGVNLQNGLAIGAGALGLAADFKAGRSKTKPGTDDSQPTAQSNPSVEKFVKKLPRKNTPTYSAADQYEIKHTGPYNYTVSGGGEKFDIDGYRDTSILEAKHVGDFASSPYVPGSSCDEVVRGIILGETRKKLTRLRTIIDSGETPFTSVEIITNTEESKALFESILKELSLKGTVQVKP